MKKEHRANGVLRGPLILMVAASNLAAVLSLDLLDGANKQLSWRKCTVGTIWQIPNSERFRRDFDEPSRAAFAIVPIIFESALSVHPDGSIMIR